MVLYDLTTTSFFILFFFLTRNNNHCLNKYTNIIHGKTEGYKERDVDVEMRTEKGRRKQQKSKKNQKKYTQKTSG